MKAQQELKKHHLEDLKRSGLNDDYIRLSGCFSVDRQKAKQILGFDPRCSCLAIPYPAPDGNGKPFTRVKPDVPFPDPTNGRPAKYLSPKNSKNHLYIPPIYRKQDLLNPKLPVIITEGEKKALKGAQELAPHFVVIALPGVWCFKTKNTALIPDFKKLVWGGRDTFIIYDNDVVQKRPVQDAENALAVQLDHLGANPYLCRIPAEGEVKMGLDDYLINHSPERLVDRVIDRALVWTPRGHIAVEDAVTFVTREIEAAEEIVECGILPAKSILMISAYSKMGKSILAIMLGICIAAGKAFLNQFPIPKAHKVLYFQQEISEKSMQDRLKKMLAYAQQEGLRPSGNLDIVNMAPLKLDTDEGLKAAKRIIHASTPDVVIWDPLYRLHSQDENSVVQMQRVLDIFDDLRSVFGIAQIIVHHHGQPIKDSGRAGLQLMRGSSVLSAFGDSYLTLTRFKKNKPSNYQKLSFDLRNAEAPEDLTIWRNPEHLWYELIADADKEDKVSTGDVVAALVDLSNRSKRKTLIEHLVRDRAAGERTIENAISQAHTAGRIKKEKVGKEVEYFLPN